MAATLHCQQTWQTCQCSDAPVSLCRVLPEVKFELVFSGPVIGRLPPIQRSHWLKLTPENSWSPGSEKRVELVMGGC